jgi:hypothetical protein
MHSGLTPLNFILNLRINAADIAGAVSGTFTFRSIHCFCVDIGASNGLRNSNTAPLPRKCGWQGCGSKAATTVTES